MSKNNQNKGHWKPVFDDTLEEIFGEEVPEKFDYYETQKVFDFIKKKYQSLLKLHGATSELIQAHDDRYENMRRKMAPLEELVGSARFEVVNAEKARDEAVSRQKEVEAENKLLNEAVEGISRLLAEDHDRFADFNDKVDLIQERLKKLQDQKPD